MTDEELVTLICGGDRQAWNELIARYSNPLLVFLLGWCSYHTAQELLQETWLSAWKGIQRGQQPRRFSAWIYTIAHRQAINHHYRDKDAHHLTLTVDVVEKADEQQEANADRIADALNEMGNGTEYDQRKAYCIREHYWHSKTVGELAKELGLPIGTVKRTLHNARTHLHRALGNPHPGEQ